MSEHVNSFRLSPIDQRILDLNHQGLKNTEITRRLKAEGIKTSSVSVGRHLLEMLQNPDNEVQVNHTRKSKSRSEGKWYKIIERLVDEIDAYTERTGFPPSQRTMFYHFQDLGLIQSKDLNAFNDATVKARMKWFNANGELLYPELDTDCFSDDSRKTVGEYDDKYPRAPEPPSKIPDPIKWVDDAISTYEDALEEFQDTPNDYDGEGYEGTDGKIGGRWFGQPEYVEAWEEKNDLLQGFETILKGKGIKIRSGKGYGSLDFMNESTWELKELMKRKHLKPEDITILYCGDCDPSGLHIDYYYQKRFIQLGIPGINFERVAVTHEQIKKYKLPLMSLEQKKAKPDSNTEEFIRQHGTDATHLNAFFTETHIEDFKKILLDAVDSHWDKSIYDKMVEEYNVKAKKPPKLSPEELENVREEMRKKIDEYLGYG